jgi:hypothetical protein
MIGLLVTGEMGSWITGKFDNWKIGELVIGYWEIGVTIQHLP